MIYHYCLTFQTRQNMIDAHTLETLDYPQVRDRIAKLALSALGGEQVSSSVPMTDLREIKRELALASEMVWSFSEDDGIPMAGIKDFREAIRQAALEGAMAEPAPLLDLASTLGVVAKLARWIAKRSGSIPGVSDIAAALEPCEELAKNINRVIDEATGEIKDSASSELSRLRRDIDKGTSALRKQAESAMRSLGDQVLSEPLVTVRDGRLVLPVKTQRQSSVPGIVHDQSASGQTLYVEPLACVEAANHVRSLETSERKEVERLLRELTNEVHTNLPRLKSDVEALSILDRLYAVASSARQTDASVPEMVESGSLVILAGRHPILIAKATDEKPVIPLDFALENQTSTVIISGPNAGGKTVALKTIGLVSLMAQTGWLVPCADGTRLPVFNQVFAEIGDEQSIEEDLSTFSGRMRSLTRFSAEAKDRTLILVDEIGSGTDPDQGAALARALLESWHAGGARTVATTHLGSLKAFAHESSWADNGSMEFDGEAFAPTFRYHHGLPGSSYALEISKRVGLKDEVLLRSEELLGDETLTAESLISDLSTRLEAVNRQAADLDSREQVLEINEKEYSERFSDIKETARRRRQEAGQEAADILKNSRALVEKTVAEIKSKDASTKSIRDAKAVIEYARQAASKTAEDAKLTVAGDSDLQIRDWVQITSMKTGGELMSIDSERKRGAVQTKNSRLDVDLSDLTKTSRPKEKRRTNSPHSSAADQASMDVDLRGMTFAEAWPVMERFLDDAYLAGLPSVRVIHGKGTGALRQQIVDELGSHPHVKNHKTAPLDQGGAGVTLVELESS